MGKTNSFGLGISPKKDWDAIILGALAGALVVPHIPMINDLVSKANNFITSKVGF